MNLSKNQPHRHISHIGFSIVAYVPDVVNYLVIMKKLLRLFMIIAFFALVLALYSFGSTMVCQMAIENIERTLGYLESSILSLVAVMLIIFIIAYWRDEL